MSATFDNKFPATVEAKSLLTNKVDDYEHMFPFLASIFEQRQGEGEAEIFAIMSLSNAGLFPDYEDVANELAKLARTYLKQKKFDSTKKMCEACIRLVEILYGTESKEAISAREDYETIKASIRNKVKFGH